MDTMIRPPVDHRQEQQEAHHMEAHQSCIACELHVRVPIPEEALLLLLWTQQTHYCATSIEHDVGL